MTLDFPRHDDTPLEWVEGRGFALYWNASLTSRPLAPRERDSALKIALDADASEAEGALARLTITADCGASSREIAVREATAVEVPELACAADVAARLTVEFLNDSAQPERDRNLYVRLTRRSPGD